MLAVEEGSSMNPMEQPRVLKFFRACLLARFLRNDNIPCEIEPGLFLGSIGSAFHKSALQNANITHILTVTAAVETPFTDLFVYKRIEVQDAVSVNLASYFETCFQFIDEAKSAGGSVLVHCFAGRSRSVTVIVAYLMKTRGWRMEQALQYVKTKRPGASPNSGFLLQLQQFEQTLQLTGESTASESPPRSTNTR